MGDRNPQKRNIQQMAGGFERPAGASTHPGTFGPHGRCQRGHLRIVLLAGGDKSSQEADIERAINIAKYWKD